MTRLETEYRTVPRACTGLRRWLIMVLILGLTIAGVAPGAVADEHSDNELPAADGDARQLSDRQRRLLRYSIMVGAPMVTFIYGTEAWDWGETSTFRWGRERWFQQDTDSGGADKLGHFFAHYLISRGLYRVFYHIEECETRRLLYPAITAGIIGTLIEIGDGFTGRYGFSWEDWVANNVGIGLAYALDRYPRLDRFIGVSGFYWPSDGFREHRDKHDKNYLNFVADYTGWKFAFNFRLAGFRDTRVELPEFMHYLQLDLGYYTRNYTVYDQYYEKPETRHLFGGISVNFSEVTRQVLPRNRATRLLPGVFRYYYVPVGLLPSHEL